ncbi:MAG: InlB B-repeat-containing protein [Eubacterium sp.]|nr:InlB B-repeat-containing protein [Eubacterium sp.]
MQKNILKRTISMFLALIMLLSVVPANAMSAFANNVPKSLVTSLTELYSGDETRAKEDLEALNSAGLLDNNGKLVDLDIREDGKSVELGALNQRITNGEKVGKITVNGKSATAEQISQISQVNAAIEVAELLDEEIDVTDEHVSNLESLLSGIQNGDVNLKNALKTGSLKLKSAGNNTLLGATDDLPETIDSWHVTPGQTHLCGDWRRAQNMYLLDLNDERDGYYAPYINGSDYDACHEFKFVDDTVTERFYYFDYCECVDGVVAEGKEGTLATGGRNAYIDWKNAIYGTDGKGAVQTYTIMLPLKTDAGLQDEIKTWIANESDSCTEKGKGIKMELPTYGEVEITKYMTSMYCSDSYNKYPVYVVTGENETPLALAVRYGTTNVCDYVRRDIISFYMKSGDIAQTAGFDWNKSNVDVLGYHSYEGTEWPVVTGLTYTFYAYPASLFNIEAHTTRPSGTYEEAENGFIKLNNPANPDFPYVKLRLSGRPEWMYDVEIAVTKDLYEAFNRGLVYMDSDEDLRFKVLFSNRRPYYSFTEDQDLTIYFNLKAVPLGNHEYEFVPTEPSDEMEPYVYFYNGTSRIHLENNHNSQNAFDYWLNRIQITSDSAPYLRVPKRAKIRETLTSLDTDVTFNTNITGSYTAELYSIGEIDENNLDAIPDGATKVKSYDFNNPGTSVTIPGADLNNAGNYAVNISTTNGTKQYSAAAFIRVKQGPAKVTLNKLESYGVVKDDVPTIGYTLTSATKDAEVRYTVQPSDSKSITVGNLAASSGTVPFTPGDFEGLKKAYTITVYARNKAEDPWSMDSMILTVYNSNPLKLIALRVPFGQYGGTTGGAGQEAGSNLIMDNTDRIKSRLATSGAGNGYQVNYDDIDFETLRRGVNLQEVISANYGSGTWGILTDKMNWAATEGSGENKVFSDDVTLNYQQRGTFDDIRNYTYTSYIPTSDFLITATENKTAADNVRVTATHVATGLQTNVGITVNTLKDQLYLFRFNPKAVSDVVYTNGDGVERKLKSDANGELAVYEPSGIKSDVVVSSTTGTGDEEVTYIGTVLNRDLVSGEQNIVKMDLYPCNNLKLVPISNTTLTFLKPDGTPYTGKVILRGGVYNGDDYCGDANLYRINSSAGDRYLRTDMEVTTNESGRTTVWFNPTEFGELTTDIRYVFEYRFENGGYQPGYVIIDPLGNTTVESNINLKTMRGSGKVPTIVRQDYQQYLNGTKPTDYTRNVIDYTGNIGISSNFSKSELYTDIVMLGEKVGKDENGYSNYVGDNVISFALYTTDGKKLTGQTDFSDAKTITKLSELDKASLFVFPFSAVPMLRSTYTMTDANMAADGITDQGKNPTSTARIKAVFTRDGLTVRTINMPFGVTNVSHQPDLNSADGATAVGGEVRNNLKETTDIGAIFRSINVNDMIRKGFVFLGNLAGMGGDNPVNLMILPTQDPATFRIIAFIGANQRDDDDDDGLSVNFNSQDLAEDMSKFKKEMDELSKKKDDDEDAGGEGSMQFNFYGTVILEAHAGVADGKWNIAFRGGNVGTNVKGKYEWGQTFFCGPYPAFISFEVGFHADLEVAFGNKASARAMLLDAALGVSVEAFAGLGFDLSIVAIQLGIYGRIGADVNFLLLTPSDQKAKTGTKLTISGEIGLKLKVKLLFISYSKKFASTGFNWSKKWNNYDQIKKYWTDEGYGELFGTTKSGRAYKMYLFDDGSTIVEVEGGAELEDRDYLELSERSWNGGKRMRKATSMTDVQTNAYPYSNPVFTDDGEMFLYISDNNNSEEAEGVVSYAVKNGDGYENKERVDTSEDNVLSDIDVVASGTKSNAFAAWAKQVESPERANKDAAVSNGELSQMFNATEIYASAYNGTKWTTERLTDNTIADMAPTVASYGNKAIVAWRSMNPSTLEADNNDITSMFNVENNINYSFYNGTKWTTAQVAYNGTTGTVNAIDSAMLSDGTALLTYTVRSGEDVSSTETFYTVVDADGKTVTSGRLTNDSYTDTNAQVTAVNENGGYFVLGWYSEHDAGEGSTVEYDAEGNATKKAVVAHDIRLACINKNGSYDIDFPESIGGSGEKGISSDFHFSAPANNTDLKNVSIVWSQPKDSDEADDAGKYELNAVRFFRADGLTALTAPTNIATTAKNYTIDRFDAYTDDSGAIHSIILGSDYSDIKGIEKYDSIDLDAAAGNTVTSNSASPQNLDILDGEAISSMKLATGTFPKTAADVSADINISEVIPNFTTPVQFTVTNTGTAVLDTVTATVGSQSQKFTGLNLLPNQSTALMMSYSVPAGAVSDTAYSVTSGDTQLGGGTLVMNRPDVGITGIKVLQEHDGQRDVQVMLDNGSEIPLAGSGKTVKLAFYKDPFHESKIGDEVSISGDALAEIDEGAYTTVQTINVTDIVELNADGEIPEEGMTVYAHAWVVDTDEPDIYNNDNYINFTGLLARNNGEKLTTDTSVEVNTNEQDEVTGYTVYADIRNNSMKKKNFGIPVALLLDAEGNVIAQKNFRDESLTLTKEQTVSYSVSFTADELNGKTPAEASVATICTVEFDLNGGTGTFDPVQSNLKGHISIPENKPTPPTVQEGEEPLFFEGWYTQAEGGEKVTEEYKFTEDTTVYAHYVNHHHEYTYSADGTTITAVCANTDTFCYLNEDAQTHKHTATLTIAEPEGEIVYDGKAHPAIITDENGIQGDVKVLYAVKGKDGTYGEATETEPVGAGTYKASITLGKGEGAATVSVEYEIKNAKLTDVSAAQNGTMKYNGRAQTPQFNAHATAVNDQTVTFTFSLTENGEYGEMPTFTNVADSATVYYKASAPNHDEERGSFAVTMEKGDRTAPKPTLAKATVNTIRLKEVEGCEYSMDGETWQDSATFTGLTKNTEYNFYQRFKETENYNTSPSSEAATISTTAHDHEWSFTANGDDSVIAKCVSADEDCPLKDQDRTVTLKILPPERTATGYGMPDAIISGSLKPFGNPKVKYYNANEDGTAKVGEALSKTPLKAGKYWAELTVGEDENTAAIHVVYEIPVVEGVSSTEVEIPEYIRTNDAASIYNLENGDPIEAMAWVYANEDSLRSDDPWNEKPKYIVYGKRYIVRPEGIPVEHWPYDDNTEYAFCYRYSTYNGCEQQTIPVDNIIASILSDDAEVYIPGTDSMLVETNVELGAPSSPEEMSNPCSALDALLWILSNQKEHPMGIIMLSQRDEYNCTFIEYRIPGSARIVNSDLNYVYDVSEWEGMPIFVAKSGGAGTGVISPNVSYNVSYNLNGGNGNVPTGGKYYVKSKIEIQSADEISKPNLVFNGWNTMPDGTGIAYKPGDKFEVLGNTTFYAQWKHEHNWTLNYDEGSHVYTATCDVPECPNSTLTLQPKAVDKMYDGENAQPYICSDQWTEENGLPLPTLTFYKGGEKVSEAKNIGTYTALVSLDGHENSVDEFKITKRPVAVIADDQEKHEGQADPELTVSYDSVGAALRFENDSNYPWQIVTEGDRVYAKSGNAGAGDSVSTMTLKVTMEKAGKLSFDYKFGTEGWFDKVHFAVDGNEKFDDSDVRDWTSYSCDLSAGSHTLTWYYTKDGGGDSNGDFYAVDNIVIDSEGEVTQPASEEKPDDTVPLDSLIADMRFKNDANYPWTEVTEGDRVYMQSGNAGYDDTTSKLTLNVTLEKAGKISFGYKYGTEEGCDRCNFYVDGDERLNVSGSGTWKTCFCDLSAGRHTLTWSYSKDGSSAYNGDFFAIDNIEFITEGEVKQEDPALALIRALNVFEGGIVEGEKLNYTISREEGEEEGTYTITVTPGENPNYDVKDVRNGTLTILESLGEPQTIEASDVSATFGDTGLKLNAAVTVGDGLLSYKVKSGDAVTVDAEGNLAIVKAGTAVITVTASRTETYAVTSKDVNVTINPKAMSVTAEDVNATVNGQPHGITVNVTEPAEGYTVKYGTSEGTYNLSTCPTLTEAGTLTVYYQVTADNYETVTGSATLTLVNHTHKLTYTAGTGEKANTITATCSNDDCPFPNSTATLAISAPNGNIVYDGNAHPAIITDENGIQGDVKVLYAVKGENGTYGEASETEPVNAGEYKASITLGTGENAATANVEYEIKNATLEDVSASQNRTLTYDGTAQTPQVNANATAVNKNKVTFTYSLTENGEFGAMPTFTNVADSGTVYFKASAPNHDTASGSFTVTMNKANRSAPAAPTADTATANMIRLTQVDGCEYSKDGENWQDSATFTGLAKKTEYTFYQRLKETANYNASPSSAAAMLSTSDHDHEWSYTADGATITATCANTDTGHSGELSATMTIAAPTLTVYGGTGDAAAVVTNNIEGIDTPTVVYKHGTTVLDAAPTDAGTYTASITVDGKTASVEYTIAKKAATVTAVNKTKTYGAVDPKLEAQVEGVVGKDTINCLLTRAEGENVGEYEITVTLGENPNYDVTANNGTFTITKKAATVTADNKSKVYSENDPALTATVDGTVGDDTINYTLSRAEGENVGKYDITVTLGDNPNYNVTVANAKLTIGKKAASVTAVNKSKTYGEDDPELTATVDGTVGDDTINYTLSRTNGDNVGEYNINVNLGDNPNYNVTAVKGTFTITKKAATVTADDLNKVYGEDDPELTATVEGTVGTDTINYTLSRAKGDNVGEYETKVTLGNNPNYNVTAVKGTFTITKKAATVTANNLSKVYSENDPELTATVEGTVGTDTINYTLSRAKGNNAGEYAITVTPGENPNYDVTALNGVFTITKKSADVTVTANNLGKVYGEDDPELTAVVTGLVGDDTLNYTLSRAEGENVGEYAITVTLGDNPNYDAAALNGTFTITKKDATVTADNLSKVYGEDDPELTATVDGTVGEDTLNYTLSRAEGENVGEYEITVNPGENPNYDVAVTSAKLTVIKADIKPVVKLEGWTYGEEANKPVVEGNAENGDVTYLYKGKGASDMSCTDVVPTQAGEYTVKADIAETANYNGANAEADFTIAKAKVTITADDKSSKREANLKKLTYKVDGKIYDGDDLGIKVSSNVKAAVAGKYVIKVAYTANANYDVTVVNGTYTVTDRITAKERTAGKNKINSAIKATVNKNGSVTAKWGAVANAERYEVYANYCSKDNEFKKIKTVKGDITSFNITKLNGKKLDQKKAVKVYVVAYRKVNGKYEKITQSVQIHVVGKKNTKYSNAKSITVKKDAYTLGVNKTATIKPTLVLQKKGKKTVEHVAKFRYQSTNTAVATVDKNGKIKAVGKGTCTIYIFANNGKLKSVKVTVK